MLVYELSGCGFESSCSNLIINWFIKKWISSLTHWGKKVITCVNNFKKNPDVIYFILNGKNCAIVLISSYIFFYKVVQSLVQSGQVLKSGTIIEKKASTASW